MFYLTLYIFFSLDKVLKNFISFYLYRMFIPLLIYYPSILLRCIISAQLQIRLIPEKCEELWRAASARINVLLIHSYHIVYDIIQYLYEHWININSDYITCNYCNRLDIKKEKEIYRCRCIQSRHRTCGNAYIILCNCV